MQSFVNGTHSLGFHQRHSVQCPRPVRAVFWKPVRVSAQLSSESNVANAQAVLDRYRALLREYRLHKQAMGDWFGSVLVKQRRPPQLLDAQETGDEALLARFQQYLMIRKRLLAEIPLLREQLDEALVQDQQHHSSSKLAKQHKHSSVNANQAFPISKAQAVGQFFAAVNYRQQHSPQTAAPTAAAGAPDVPNKFAVAEAVAPAAVPTSAAGAAAASPANMQMQLHAGTEHPVVSSNEVPSSSSSSTVPSTPADQSRRVEDAASHILSATTSSPSSSSRNSNSSSGANAAAASGRAAAAALAALAYKKRKQTGSSSSESSTAEGGFTSSLSGSRQQRPLAMQLAEPPKPPPGYDAAAVDTASSSSSGSHEQQPVVPLVETGKVADVYARAPRRERALDSDLSLEITLQGIPGGLGGELSGQLFAATTVLEDSAAATAATTATTATATTAGPPMQQQQAVQSGPAGEVLTARFDVHSGRQRVLDPAAQLDDFLKGLSEAYSQHPAAAAAAASSSNASSSSSSSNVAQPSAGQAVPAADKQQQKQKAGKAGGYGSDSGRSSLEMPPEVVPLPT